MSRKILSFFISCIFLFSLLSSFISSQGNELHVYYGYVPPSSDVGAVDELVNGKMINYTVPSGNAILDVVGYYDNTKVELYDLTSGRLLNSTTINRLDRITFFLPYGTYFKLVTSARVGAMLSGGWAAFNPGTFSGFATFYPSVEGGFRGKDFIFMAAPPTHAYAYSKDLVDYNFFLFALEDIANWKLVDRTGRFSTSDSTKQRGVYYTLLQSRISHQGISAGAGYDMIYQLNSSNDIMLSSAALGQVIYVPCITGGYVGKIFYAPDHATLQQNGRSIVVLIVPLEAGKVTIYDRNLNVLAEHTFTDADVANNAYWFKSFGLGRFEFIIKSTGNITVLAAQTYGGSVTSQVSEDIIGDGITFLGSRPNQELRFFTPSSAIVFSPENQSAVIDGESKPLRKDDVILLGSGVHVIKGTGHLIVQIVAPGVAGFQKWGSYLIEELDIDKSFPDIPTLATPGTPYLTYAAVIIVVVLIIAAIYFFKLRKKR